MMNHGHEIKHQSDLDHRKFLQFSSLAMGLDSFNCHFDSKKNYHCHATKTYPYINGGFKRVVTEKDGEVNLQSATKAFRLARKPLQGALITGLERLGESTFELKYTLNESDYHVKYAATLKEVNE